VLNEIQTREWDLVTLDVTMPGRSGIEILSDLKRVRPKLPVLVLSMHPERQYGKRMLQGGAAGYMNKESAPEELIKAVRKVLTGGRYVGAALAEALAAELGWPADQLPHERISDRELEVLRLIGAGKAPSEIADVLNVSISTIGSYRARLLEKMGLTTTSELVAYAFQHGLLQ